MKTKSNNIKHFHLQPFLNILLCNCFILHYKDISTYKYTSHSTMQIFLLII